ncbi:hypothetical protein F9C07_8833 [Aspergillus flavus]|uniref:Uncharacterized protein n=1 Tax=Aspergillus flavus (strain ATCC 200026 / FGSC A1120 / IAM 13836 / NRRL 3357 / JCM 12722 / SRRC 167) TaxID=332952 RepID=A0A7U2MIW5_ASPFN|nr:hypothetical protein F9C07_8833 [Aspergillus flavus]
MTGYVDKKARQEWHARIHRIASSQPQAGFTFPFFALIPRMRPKLCTGLRPSDPHPNRGSIRAWLSTGSCARDASVRFRPDAPKGLWRRDGAKG